MVVTRCGLVTWQRSLAGRWRDWPGSQRRSAQLVPVGAYVCAAPSATRGPVSWTASQRRGSPGMCRRGRWRTAARRPSTCAVPAVWSSAASRRSSHRTCPDWWWRPRTSRRAVCSYEPRGSLRSAGGGERSSEGSTPSTWSSRRTWEASRCCAVRWRRLAAGRPSSGRSAGSPAATVDTVTGDQCCDAPTPAPRSIRSGSLCASHTSGWHLDTSVSTKHNLSALTRCLIAYHVCFVGWLLKQGHCCWLVDYSVDYPVFYCLICLPAIIIIPIGYTYNVGTW